MSLPSGRLAKWFDVWGNALTGDKKRLIVLNPKAGGLDLVDTTSLSSQSRSLASPKQPVAWWWPVTDAYAKEGEGGYLPAAANTRAQDHMTVPPRA